MAVTKIHAIKTTLKKALDYIRNPEKTSGKLYEYGYMVSPETAYLEFQATAEMNNYKSSNNVLAHHLIQSFAKGEVSPEQAHEIGKQLADKLLKGKYEYVLTTHLDKGHVHNHIIFNSVSCRDFTKFRTKPYETAREIRGISDTLCVEHGLSVIKKTSKVKGKDYKEWSETQKGTSWKAKLKETLDSNIIKAKTWEDFLQLMEKSNYEIKQGKHISFRAKGQEKFTRAKTIGEKYTEENIKNAIADKTLKRNPERTMLTETTRKPLSLEYLLLAKEKVRERKNKASFVGSVRQSRLQNLANQISFVNKEGLTNLSSFANRLNETKLLMEETRDEVKASEATLEKLNTIIRYVNVYEKNTAVYKQYQTSIMKKAFLNKHQENIDLYELAKSKLLQSGLQSDDDIQEFKITYQSFEEKLKLSKVTYRNTKEDLKMLLNIQSSLVVKKKQTEPTREKKKNLTR